MKRGVTWTAVKPTEPGFWWLRTRSKQISVLHVIRVRGGLGCLVHGVARDRPFPVPTEYVAWGGLIPKPRRWSESPPTTTGWYWVEGPQLLRTIAEVVGTDEGGLEVLLLGREWPPGVPFTDKILAGCAWSPIHAPKP